MKRVRPLILAATAAAIAALLIPASAQAAPPASTSTNAAETHVQMQLNMQTYDENDNPIGSIPLDPTAGGELDGVDVIFWQLDAGSGYYYQLDPSAVSWEGTLGGMWIATVPEGTYKIQFVPTRTSVSSGYWSQGESGNFAPFFGEATDVPTSNIAVDLGGIMLPYRSFWTARVFGQDRFGTAAAASMSMYPGSPQADQSPSVVYVANGMNYPDALAAGPAAIINGAPLLLTFPTSLPAATAKELTRLQPENVVVLGSPGAVSDAVKTAIGQAAGVSGDNLRRIGGADRYSTGNLIVRDAWLGNGFGANVAIIATGRNYPDALAAGPAAGYWGVPVILVDGNAATVPAATLTLLKDLGVEGVALVGSASVVSSGIENQLNGLLTGGAFRLAGTTRYETAQAINDGFFGPTDEAFFANGLNFPDALSGAPLAGWFYAPLYLTPQSCVGAPAAQGTIDHHVNGITLLGSSSVLSTDVEDLILCDGAGVSYTSAPTGKAGVAQQGVKLSPLVELAKSGKSAKPGTQNPSRLESTPLDTSKQKAESFTR